MKIRKLASLLLCAAIAFSAVPCSAAEEGSAINFDEEPYTLKVCYACMGEAQPDLALIEEKINEISLEKINALVDFEAINISSLANVYALKAASQEKMDLMVLFPAFNYLTSYVNSNLLAPLEEQVEQWGPDIKAVVGDMLPAGEYKGHLYAIPQNRGVRTNGYGFNLSRALCEKHGIDPASIKTLEDLEAIFAQIKEAEPDVTVLMPEGLSSYVITGISEYQDTLGIGGGVLSTAEDGSLKVVNPLELPGAMDDYKKVREWYEKGYISKDVLTSQNDGVTALKAGKCFATSSVSIDSSMGNNDYVSIILRDELPLVGTSADQMIMWGVPNSCERPDKAVQFLNLCDSSTEITNLFQYGIEGVHYTLVQDGVVDDSTNANWVQVWPQLGDNRKSYTTEGYLNSMGVTTFEEYKEKLSGWEVELSPAYGFNFDPTDVRTEIAACDAVNAEFGAVLGNGTVDPEEELPKYIEKLYDAGLQKVMDEKQRQLDEWVASQK